MQIQENYIYIYTVYSFKFAQFYFRSHIWNWLNSPTLKFSFLILNTYNSISTVLNSPSGQRAKKGENKLVLKFPCIHSLHEKLFDLQALWTSILVILTSRTQFYRPKLFYHKGFKECMDASNINWLWFTWGTLHHQGYMYNRASPFFVHLFHFWESSALVSIQDHKVIAVRLKLLKCSIYQVPVKCL